MNTKTTGVAAITGASLMWAIEPIFAKLAYESSDYLETLVLSSVYQVMVGLTAGIGTILYYEGLKRIKAAQVSALELSRPLFAALLSFMILQL